LEPYESEEHQFLAIEKLKETLWSQVSSYKIMKNEDSGCKEKRFS